MDSIAEIITPQRMVYYRFDDENREAVHELEDALCDLAEDGVVCELSFHTEQ